MHLADAFMQTDFQCIQDTFIYLICEFSQEIEPLTLVSLASHTATWRKM